MTTFLITSLDQQGIKMARETYDDIHEKALRRFDMCYNAQWAVREKIVECMRFARIPGAQWEGATAAGTDIEGQFQSFPKYEVNKVASEVNRIISEYRNNRITVKFRPSTKEASDELAQKLNGKFLADVQESSGDEAFDNAFDDAVTGGFGAWRIGIAQDESDIFGERKKIIFEPIYDAARSVWFDPDAKKYDKSDAHFCFCMYSITPQKYKDLYGDDSPTSMKSLSFNIVYDWFRPNVIYLAKYYERVIVDSELITYRNELTQQEVQYDRKEANKLEDELEEYGYIEVSRRKTRRPVVYCYLMDGNRIIGNRVEIPGGHIPIFPVYGKRWFIDDIERVEGHVQKAMDAQRIYNLQISQLADVAGKSNDELPIFDPEQVRGLEHFWEFRQQENYSFLLARPLKDRAGNIIGSGPIGYTKPPQVPPAMAALIQITNQDIRESTGDGSQLNQLPNNLAEGTVDKIFSRQDTNSFIYSDNFSKTMKRCGQVWLAMSREINNPNEETRIVMEDGSDDIVFMRNDVIDEVTGSVMETHEITEGSYDVVTDVGPSYATQRDNAVRNLSNVLATIPPQHPYFDIIMSLMIENMDGAGIDEVHPYVREQMLVKGVVKPRTPEEKQIVMQAQQEAANQPDPNMVIAMSQDKIAKAELINAETKSADVQIKAFAAQSDAQFKQAQTIKAYAEAENISQEKMMQALNIIRDYNLQQMRDQSKMQDTMIQQ